MKDGVDRKTLSAELKALAPEARRDRMRAFRQWTSEAAAGANPLAYASLLVTLVGVAIVAFSVFVTAYARPLLPIAMLVILIGAGLNIASANRARTWRRRHPFDSWRSQRDL